METTNASFTYCCSLYYAAKDHAFICHDSLVNIEKLKECTGILE